MHVVLLLFFIFYFLLADHNNGRAYATGLCLSVVCRVYRMYCS